MSHLTLEQRYKIEAYLNLGKGISEISDYIGKDKSIVSREIQRNSDGRSGLYKADLAHLKTMLRHNTKKKNIRFSQQMQDYVLRFLSEHYSPEQIVGRARLEGVEMVSHERIYEHIWKDKRSGGKLHQHLRTKGRRYRKRGSLKDKRGMIPGRTDISERPAIVERKERIGIWKSIWLSVKTITGLYLPLMTGQADCSLWG